MELVISDIENSIFVISQKCMDFVISLNLYFDITKSIFWYHKTRDL